MNECVGKEDVPSWLVESRTVLIQKDQNKGNAAGNYRPIACLNVIWKVFTGMLSENFIPMLKAMVFSPKNKRVAEEDHVELKTNCLLIKLLFETAKEEKQICSCHG